MSLNFKNELKAKDYLNLLGIDGLSDELLKNHFMLYGGYVKNSNKIEEELIEFFKTGKTDSPSYAELKRRAPWELNGVKLHEYYFENLTKSPKEIDKKSEIYKKITEHFGSLEAWQTVFKATGAMRGIGWVILYYDPSFDRFFNIWINEHDQGHLAGAVPLLVMDVFEHAYMLDYGTKKAGYVDTFMKNINWEVVDKRLSAR